MGETGAGGESVGEAATGESEAGVVVEGDEASGEVAEEVGDWVWDSVGGGVEVVVVVGGGVEVEVVGGGVEDVVGGGVVEPALEAVGEEAGTGEDLGAAALAVGVVVGA